MILRNCWYVIAWDHEVPPGGLFARTVLASRSWYFAPRTAASRRWRTGAATGMRRCRRDATRAMACAAAITD